MKWFEKKRVQLSEQELSERELKHSSTWFIAEFGKRIARIGSAQLAEKPGVVGQLLDFQSHFYDELYASGAFDNLAKLSMVAIQRDTHTANLEGSSDTTLAIGLIQDCVRPDSYTDTNPDRILKKYELTPEECQVITFGRDYDHPTSLTFYNTEHPGLYVVERSRTADTGITDGEESGTPVTGWYLMGIDGFYGENIPTELKQKLATNLKVGTL